MFEDLSLLAETLRASEQPLRICRALEKVSGETIGHRLFTVMRFDGSRSEVQRIHTNLYDPHVRRPFESSADQSQTVTKCAFLNQSRHCRTESQ